MKLWAKEALLIGGIYEAVETPLVYLNINEFVNILFILFIVYSILLCFNIKPKFIVNIQHKYPNISYYLMAMGWVPYFSIICLVTIILIASYFEWTDILLEKVINIYNFTITFGALISLIIAAIMKRRR